jgi:hypothetical protein
MVQAMNDRTGVKVLIVNDDGRYLTGTAIAWEFTDDRGKARVFDYVDDEVAEKIEMVRKVQGRVWIAVKLDPREIYEFCDQCGRRMLAAKAFFNGDQFLCEVCKQRQQ